MQDSKKLKNIIGHILVFFLLLTLMFIGMSYVLQNKVMTDDKAVQISEKPLVNLQKEPANTIDMIVLGNSLSYTSVVPQQMQEDFGYNTWLCGQSGQLVQATYYSLETAFQTQTPNVVLIEASVMLDGGKGADSWNHSVEIWARYRFPFLHFHDLWKTYLMGKTYEEESYHGYIERKTVEPYIGGPYMIPTEEIAVFRNNSPYYIRKLKKLCDEHNTRMILYSCPSPKNYNYAAHNAFTAWSQEQKIEYIDMNLLLEELNINWEEDALDGGDHLNSKGAAKTTRYLGEYLTQEQSVLRTLGAAGCSADLERSFSCARVGKSEGLSYDMKKNQSNHHGTIGFLLYK